jgi:hypothetical protein
MSFHNIERSGIDRDTAHKGGIAEIMMRGVLELQMVQADLLEQVHSAFPSSL